MIGYEEKGRLNKQSKQVFEAMQTGAWVNQIDAMRWSPPVMRLASRIHDIRESGYEVESRKKGGGSCLEYRLSRRIEGRLF